MMVYEGHDIVDKVSIIHGTNSGNFHISKNMTEDAQHRIGYLVDTPTWVFRPPWQNLGHGAAIKKRELQANAKKVSESAKYGKAQIVGLQSANLRVTAALLPGSERCAVPPVRLGSELASLGQ
jgi:hypothetical protein